MTEILNRFTRTLIFAHSVTGTLTWIADRDYEIVEVCGSAQNWVLSFDGTTVVAIAGPAVFPDLIAFRDSSRRLRIPFRAGKTLYSASSGAMKIVVVLESIPVGRER